jgi:tellurite resistance protein TerC
MQVPLYAWILTVIGIVGLLAFDFFFHVRKAHSPKLKESAAWSAIYVGLALAFGM